MGIVVIEESREVVPVCVKNAFPRRDMASKPFSTGFVVVVWFAGSYLSYC
jgi:hypothetical protein